MMEKVGIEPTPFGIAYSCGDTTAMRHAITALLSHLYVKELFLLIIRGIDEPFPILQ